MMTKTCAATGLVIAALGGALLMSSPASAGGFPSDPSSGDLNVNTNNIENSNTSTNENTNTNTATIPEALI